MGTTCKHGVDTRYCAVCQQAGETVPIRTGALQVTREGRPVMVLTTRPGSTDVAALMLDGASARLATLEGSTLGAPSSAFDRRAALDQFRRVSMTLGYLFQPENALTTRELTAEGPPWCYSCHTELSLAKQSLGCTQCRYYVCHCGRCLCGYTGTNYLGQVFRQFPSLPIPRKVRLEFVRVVRFCGTSD